MTREKTLQLTEAEHELLVRARKQMFPDVDENVPLGHVVGELAAEFTDQ